MESTFERVVQLLREKCELEDSVELTEETTFQDIDLDSLAVVEVALECEDEFGIQIDVEEPPKTLGEFVRLVERLINA